MSPRHEDDELRARLARLDPAGALPVEPASGSRAAEQMERAMQTLEPPSAPGSGRLTPRRLALAGGTTLAAAAAVTAGVLAWDGDPVMPVAEPTTLTLAMPPGDQFASCVPFEVEFLADMSPAFGGTAVEVGEEHVVLDVDRWYAGGDADQVRLEAPGGAAAQALGYGVHFEEGQRYLVTAANGTVNGCGFSGPATPELERAFDTAFAD